MSKEYVRQLVTQKFKDFGELTSAEKAYPNLNKLKTNFSSPWADLVRIDFVKSGIASVGHDPNVRRTGVITIEVFDNLNKGTAALTKLTDSIEQAFELWTNAEGNFWTGAANTVDNEDDASKAYYKFTVYIPFTYDSDTCETNTPSPPDSGDYVSPPTINSWLDQFNNNLN